ncbi:MAG: peptide chain release factor N(5)-glutamine methyltransferase [Betaproteobacteria bacterium]|nr:peptide chain release factor N(5)-glutamine methyltransferase [Betaproteobacteria bacterium]
MTGHIQTRPGQLTLSTSISTFLAQRAIAKREAEMLIAAALGTTRAYVIAHTERTLSVDEEEILRGWIARRASGEPMAYVLGTREFYGRDFHVSPETLIPRPETELLVEQALARISGNKWLESRPSAGVLDLGTGSGAIAISIALALTLPDGQGGIAVTATDISPAALDTARLNAKKLGTMVDFIVSNWYAELSGRKFDLIVSNPPYVAGNDIHLVQGDLRFEPQAALTDGSTDGLDSIRTIIAGAAAHLVPYGWLLLEHGYDQADECRTLLLKAGFDNLISYRDLAGIPRVAGGQIR